MANKLFTDLAAATTLSGTEVIPVSQSGATVKTTVAAIAALGGAQGGAGATVNVQDEGTPLSTAADTFNFVGAGVTASGTGTTKTITIPGSSGGTWGSITGTLSSQSDLNTALSGKQATLVSATNIKTINSTSLLGSGDIVISGGGGTWGSITGTLTSQSDLNTALTGKAPLSGGYVPPANLGSGSSITTKFLRGDGTWQVISGGGDALVANPLSQFAATTSAQLAGVISDETGSGALVFATSPALVTPALGTPSSGTLTNCSGLPGASGITGTVAPANLGSGASITTKFLRGDSTWQAIAGGGDALVANPLSQFAATTSAQLLGVISDETGTGSLVFAGSPALTGSPTAPTQTQADNSTKLATTAYVDTLGATKVTALAAVDVSAVATLTTASHSNRHLYATTDANTTRALPSSGQGTGDFIEYTNHGAVPHVFTGGVAAAGMTVTANPGATIQFIYQGQWDAITDANVSTIPTAGDKSANYTTVLGDAGKRIRHPSTDANARTFTIDGTLAYLDGTVMTFVNRTTNVVSVALTGGSGTLRLGGSATTGTRSVAQHGYCTVMLDGGDWLAAGPGVT